MTVMNFVPEAIFPTLNLESAKLLELFTQPIDYTISTHTVGRTLPISKHVQEWSGSMNHFLTLQYFLSSKTFYPLIKSSILQR